MARPLADIAFRFTGTVGAVRLNLALDMANADITGIRGPSGCGKSSLLRAIAGLHRFAQGYCRVGPAIWQDETRFLPPWKRSIGYVPQDGGLFAHLSVRNNLLYGTKGRGHDTATLWEDVIAALDLRPLLGRRTHALSGGERQRVAIGRALLTQPTLLLMDEPLSALDWQTKINIISYMKVFLEEKKITTLYVSHDQEEIDLLCKNVRPWPTLSKEHSVKSDR